MPYKLRQKFFGSVIRYFSGDKQLKARLPLVYAILSVKWCQIILNVFLGKEIARDRLIYEKQLMKAKRKLIESKRELNELVFPYSLINEAN